MALATINGAALNTALVPQVTALVEDMRARRDADSVVLASWRATHAEAVAQERTATSWTDWSEDQLTQAAVGWLLTSVFVRFCEDNLLLGSDSVWITHPDPLLRGRAIDAENAFYRANPSYSYREWLEQSFAALRANPATVSLVDEHAALHIIEPSSDAVAALLEFWRRTDDAGALEWTFTNPELTTRFLGDLYQDLSIFAQKKYALLQTPDFVEEFILDRTLEPALKDRPLEGFKVIDPTCGSGHFLLGAFDRLAARWHQHAPAMEPRARVDQALSSIHGVDLNPFAVAIAKFRLIVAALRECGESTLVDAPRFTLNLVNGDSLLHGVEQGGATAFDYGDVSFDKDAVAAGFTYSTEDSRQLRNVLAPGQYDAVVGNPPYITVKDKALNTRYREIYHYCKGKYALTVPFMEKFFTLAKTGERAGWVGQITSNSFMKREFGVPLIEEYLGRLDLRLVADTSGAYIPGHGTPTVIIVGRNHAKTQETVRAVLGIQGEPGAPADPAKGKVWSSIEAHVDEPGYEDQWISVTDLPRENLRKHPWSLSGGGAVELASAIDLATDSPLSEHSDSIGITSFTLEDSVYLLDLRTPARLALAHVRPMVLGDQLRDWTADLDALAVFPYTDDFEPVDAEEVPKLFRFFWPYKTSISNSKMFGNQTKVASGLRWTEYGRLTVNKLTTPLSITFAFVATHNHFVLDRGGKVFKQSAPVIKLPVGASEDDHLRLLGVLNSSTACFWLKQNRLFASERG
ncbi:BREX-2 system adenine-specific DNA-methyltransferase PglX [Dietzia cercidiphylli]|uniref:BREX-2 system adenine-specific DNA-methyltransferase PglX n=1 Tax=Dietzia cercidiphylli TaxID=498199 RepID=UPI003F7E1F59